MTMNIKIDVMYGEDTVFLNYKYSYAIYYNFNRLHCSQTCIILPMHIDVSNFSF